VISGRWRSSSAGVTVVRAGRRVLDEVTARIPGAGITVVSGPSGAGKTTLLRLCNRLEVPDEGTVCYRGQPLDELDPLALASFSAAAVVTLGVLFGLHVFPLTGRTLVPIAGMMVGNSMTATVLAGRRLTDELRDKRHEVEARLALGQPSRQTAAPYVRAALRAALTPQIETTKATGLVFLPGAMTGLILVGTAPLQAVLVQAVVMFLVLAATATTTVVIALGLIRRLFTPDHRLVYLPAPAGQ
jgi:UDP-glucose/iron transport system permease protein